MTVKLLSFAKINLGLRIGALRPDGFHELRTVYQTIALHDVIRVSIGRGSGIEIRCEDPRVPKDSSNTCFRIVERAMQALKARGRVIIEIEKRLPVQGGLGGASGNAVAALLALEVKLKKKLSGPEKFRVAAEVGSDLPLFLVGGTVLGVGRGEEVFPLPDLPAMACVIATPEIAVSTPKAFADWDRMIPQSSPQRLEAAAPSTLIGTSKTRALPETGGHNREGTASSRAEPIAEQIEGASYGTTESRALAAKLTPPTPSDRMIVCSREISAWLCAGPGNIGRRRSGVSARGGGRAETLQLDLVRTGIENDFEKVVFPQYPELRKVKSVLERAGARYASLSGSGSAVYGLFGSREKAAAAAKMLIQAGVPAVATSTLTRRQYWRKLRAMSY